MIRAFLTGAAGYPLLEILWRGRSHPTMALAGGVSLTMLRGVSRLPLRPLQQVLMGGAAITAVEYAIGRRWNRDFRIWDYRRMPLQLHGQICLPYSLLWCGLSACALPVFRAARKKPDGS